MTPLPFRIEKINGEAVKIRTDGRRGKCMFDEEILWDHLQEAMVERDAWASKSVDLGGALDEARAEIATQKEILKALEAQRVRPEKVKK